MTEKKQSTPTTQNAPDNAPELAADLSQSPAPQAGPDPKPQSRSKATAPKKIPIKLRLDADVLAALRASGRGWQTRINDNLRSALHLAWRV